MKFKTFKRKVLPIIVTLFTASSLTIVSMLYANGYRISLNSEPEANNTEKQSTITVKKTGILAVRSIPDSAKVYLDDKLMSDVTDTTITSLAPGDYNLKVKKDGFEPWEKDVEVYEDLVTDVTALLVRKGGGLNPLTDTGVRNFKLSNNGEMLAYMAPNEQRPGLWTINLSNNPLNIFQTNKKAIVLDNQNYTYSSGEEIFWSPDDQEILVKINENGYYLVDLSEDPNQIPTVISNPQPIFDEWKRQRQRIIETRIASLSVGAELYDEAIAESTKWSPDGEKFMYLENTEKDKERVVVYNFEEPLPVNEDKRNVTIEYEINNKPEIYWYSDSKHLLLVKDDRLSIIHIDGSNRVELFSGKIIGDKAYPTPGGGGVMILSNIRSDAPTNIYTVSIR